MNKEKDQEDVHKNDDYNRAIKGITFITCPIHNISYPKGSTCPQCDSDKRKKA